MNKSRMKSPISDSEIADLYEKLDLSKEKRRENSFFSDLFDEASRPAEAQYEFRLSHNTNPVL